MKIGIDIDGVVADYFKKFLEFYNKKTGNNILIENWVTYNFWDFLPITKEEGWELMNEFYLLDDFDEMPLIEGAKEAILQLSKENEVYIITARPLKWEEKTKRFFDKHFPGEKIKLIHCRDDKDKVIYKREICNNLGINILIEDYRDIALQCAEIGVRVILLDSLYNKNIQHENVIRAKNWNEILEKINELNKIKLKNKNNSGFLPETEEYFASLGEEIKKSYSIAEKARAMGLDPVDKVEVPLALTMASKVVKLIATKYPQLDDENIINRILDLEKQYGALDNSVSFTIAREIAQEKYCKFKTQLEAIDAGIRVGFAYNTLGVVSSPIEGFTEVRAGKTQTGETYLKAFFSGPIRSAGTTAACVVIILIDYLRQVFGYAKYDPTEKECRRVVTELYDFHERVSNLQYLPSEDEAYFIAKNCPIQIAGEPTEKREVSNYKNLARVESDFIRGGMCLTIGEGIAQKAAKGLRILKKLQKNNFKINDWEWLDEYVKLHEQRNLGKTDASPTYIKDLVAGRPVFGYPGKGFRFRYGRGRVAGFSAVSVHPATMAVTNDFLATGTQLKIEKPTKGCVVTLCDDIDGPIVKFKNQSVKKMNNYEETKLLYNEIEEIIYLGDILFPLGDVINRNSVLITPGYVEEWWALDLEKAIENKKTEEKKEEIEQVKKEAIDYFNISIEKAIEISKEYKIPLHPSYIYYWTQITWDEFLGFIDWFQHSRINNEKLLFPYNKTEKIRFQIGKRALELLGVAHEVGVENVILDKNETKALLINLGFDKDYNGELQIEFDFKNYLDRYLVINNLKEKQTEVKEGEVVLSAINEISKFKIKDKAGEFIGSRMGRPEKAKLRKLTGSPSVLFPIGEEGGRLRSANEALKKGFVKAEFPFYYCNKCNTETIYRVCEICNERTEQKYYCKMCKSEINTSECEEHKIGFKYKPFRIDMQHYFEKAREKLGYLKTDMPVLIKGVRGTSSENHNIENFVKGILRSKYNLCVNKDGTIRYDMTELPVTHFKPKEIEVSLDKLRELGYTKDQHGKELVNEDQILELKPHDIIIPCNNLAGDEKADDVFINVSKFIDELLIKFYNLPAFYNIEKRSDLIGKLCVCMAPHNCAGVIGRIIGFSKVQGLFASPYMHAAMRRDCFDYNTYIPIKQNKVWKNIKIGELVEKLNPEKIVDNYGTKEKKVEGFETIGFDGKKLIKVRINNFTKHTKLPMFEIKTSLGKKINVTENHKFLVDNNLVKASDLRKGDCLIIAKEVKIGYKGLIKDLIVSIEPIGEKESYCLNVNNKNHLVVANNIVTKNCDGDESAVILLLDVLINFSRKFLPAHRGGTQDAPLVLNGQINAKEVDDQILDFELVEKYPLELYEKAEQKLHSGEINIEMVRQRIGRGEDPFIHTGFTHNTENFNLGATCSSYKTLPTMKEKVEAQMVLCEKLRSVDQGDVARLIIDRHFIRDLKGNLRKFSQQAFRCGKCNEIYRRPPLNGKCEKCGNPKLIFTIAYGSIVKYLEPALGLTRNFNVPPYITQDLELTKKYIESIFGKETEKQENMDKWF